MAEETITAQTPETDPGMSVMPDGPGPMDVPTVIPELGLAAQALASQVSFAKKTWKDGSGGGTPVTAAELNRLEQGVADLTAAVNGLRDSVGKPVTVEIGDALIGDQGYFSLLTVQAFMTAIGGTSRNIIRLDLATYESVTPATPFSLFGYWVIGQPGATVRNLKVKVWTNA